MRVEEIGTMACLVVGTFFLTLCAGAQSTSEVNLRIQEVMIPMSDGGALAADVYLPGEGTYPTVLTISMAPKSKSQKAHFPQSSFFNSGDYAVVCVERRGSSGSADNPPRPGINPDGHDGYDVVEWIASQSWSDGKVGMWGASNQGKIQYATAMTHPPHLVCIMPAETRPQTRERGYLGMTYDEIFPGGVMRVEMVQNAGGKPSGDLNSASGGMANRLKDHLLDDGFFDLRPEGAPVLEDIKIPIMAVGAWFDNDINRATTELFARILNGVDPENLRSSHRLLIGPWTHNGVYGDKKQGQMLFPGAAVTYRKYEKLFFDYWLRDEKNGQEDVPQVVYYEMGVNEWQTSPTWPPADVSEVSYYLHPDAKLSLDAPIEGSHHGTIVSNPENPTPTVGGQNKKKDFGKGPYDQSPKVETHDDVIVFTTDVLEEDVRVAGDVVVKVFLSSDSEDTDVVFRLTDVIPAAGSDSSPRSMLLRDGIVRMSLRNSRKAYEYLTPETVYEANIVTIPIAHTFLKGHRIRLIISATNYPRYGINTNTDDKTDTPQKAVNTLHFSAEHPSALVLSRLDN